MTMIMTMTLTIDDNDDDDTMLTVMNYWSQTTVTVNGDMIKVIITILLLLLSLLFLVLLLLCLLLLCMQTHGSEKRRLPRPSSPKTELRLNTLSTANLSMSSASSANGR